MKATPVHAIVSGIFRCPWIGLLGLVLATCGGHAVGSIGVKLARNQKTGQVRVFEAPPGTGQRAGLAAGDVIVAIDGKDVHAFGSDEEIRKALRGDVGTRVKLTVEREGERREIEIERGALAEER